MRFDQQIQLGTTGLVVGRLGVASSYRAPQEAYEEAFEQGCNYFTWGSFIRGRSGAMADAIRAIIARGQRDRLVLSMVTQLGVPNTSLPSSPSYARATSLA